MSNIYSFENFFFFKQTIASNDPYTKIQLYKYLIIHCEIKASTRKRKTKKDIHVLHFGETYLWRITFVHSARSLSNFYRRESLRAYTVTFSSISEKSVIKKKLTFCMTQILVYVHLYMITILIRTFQFYALCGLKKKEILKTH